LHGRSFATPEDVEQLFVPVIGHRVLLDPTLLVDEELTRAEAIERLFATCLERAPRPRPDWVAEAHAARG
jgi:MoxR-like ATPase